MATIRPDSEVRLIKNVPFSNNYRDVMRFNSKQEQEAYFTSLPGISLNNFKYVRNNGALKVPYYRDEILEYNYIMFKNKAYGDKYFYAFINNISYVNPNTSLITFELDVWSTWFMDVTIKPSYIEREHCKRWNSDGSPVINTIPENLDYGTEYVVKSQKRLYDLDNKCKIKWLVIGMNLDVDNFKENATDPGDLGSEQNIFYEVYIGEGITTNMCYAVIPIPEYGDNQQGSTINDELVYPPYLLLWTLAHSSGFVNKINTIFVTDFLPIRYEVTNISAHNLTLTSSQIIMKDFKFKITGRDVTNTLRLPLIINAFDNDERSIIHSFTFTNKYEALKEGITESKLLMYPYSFNVLTDLQGDMFTIKNEYVDGNNITIDIRSGINISNKVAYTVSNYLGMGSRRGMLYLDNGIINANDNRISVIDDYATAYIQGNMNSVKESIRQTQQNTDLANKIAGRNAKANTDIRTIRNEAGLYEAGYDVLSGIVAGASTLNPLRAGADILQGNIAGARQLNQDAMNTKITNVENEVNLGNTRLKGELANQQAIATINAKISDARNVADNITLQGGDVAFNYGYENLGCKIIAKQITQEYIDILQNYFKVYGYAVHKVKTPNIHTRRSFNYVQTVGCRCIGNIPDMFIEGINAIFNNGVTIWHVADVGNYDLNNDEI